MEKDERSSATWEAARDDCAEDKKRLPEPGEFKWACKNVTGLNDMTNDYEWASNYVQGYLTGSGNGNGVASIQMGNGNCVTANTGWVAYSIAPGTETSRVYRCVR